MFQRSHALTAVLLLGLSLCSRATYPANVASEKAKIVEAVEQMYVAIAHDDPAKFLEHTTPDFFTFDGGMRFTGPQLVQLIKDAHAAGKIYVWKVTEPVVELYGTAALITYTNVGSVTDAAGEKKDVSWLESATLEKVSGVWRVHFFHSTRVPPPKAP
jgi:ketosteroid isomerase-like protein